MGQPALQTEPEDEPPLVIWRPQQGPQKALVDCPYPEVFYGGARGGGKALAHGEPILTPWGSKAIETCEIGDQALNPDGTTARIIGVYPQGLSRVYRVTVDDGAHVDVTGDHLWLARVTGRKLGAERLYLHSGELVRWRVWTTEQLISRVDVGIRIPLTQPVSGQATSRHEVASDPYVLGLMLGDGCLVNSLRFTAPDLELQTVAVANGFRQSGRPIEFFARQDTPLAADLKRLGLRGMRSWQKSVPHRYLHATADVRLAMLQGLLDTDGYADERGHIEFSSTSRQLADDVQELVRGLGGKATLGIKAAAENAREAYRLHIRHADPARLFRLKRKRERCIGKAWNGGDEHTRKITAIEPIGEASATCIKVDHPNGLFLTRGHIVTHNTDGVLGKYALKAERYGPAFNAVFFRRELPNLDDAIERSKELYGPLGAHWQNQAKTWRFPWGGRLRFRPLESVADAEKYQGQNISDACVEEAGQYPSPAPIDRLNGVLRSASGVPTQLILTGNPGGAGQGWIKGRYIDPAPLGMKRLTRLLPNGAQHQFIFIPSKVQNNRILLRNDPDYINRLYLVGNVQLVRAWLEGDWSAVEGAYFPEFSIERHVIAPCELPDHWMRFRAMDWGSPGRFQSAGTPLATAQRHFLEGP